MSHIIKFSWKSDIFIEQTTYVPCTLQSAPNANALGTTERDTLKSLQFNENVGVSWHQTKNNHHIVESVGFWSI